MRFAARWYGPEISEDGPEAVERILAPGIVGFTVEHDGHLYVPAFRAEHPGHGAARAFLASLPPSTRIPNVLTDRLANHLRKTGWNVHIEWAEGAGWNEMPEAVEVWEKP